MCLRSRLCALLLALPFLPVLAGCSQDMWDGARVKPLQQSAFFADGRSARPLPDGVVARGSLADDGLKRYAAANGAPIDTLPFPLTQAVLDRGQQRFDADCSECHGRTGYGNGMIVKRGYPPPPSYHTDRLRRAPLGHFVDVITNGYGVMYPYRDRVKPADRWAIAAYIRALQLSQNASVNDVPADHRADLDRPAPASVPPEAVPVTPDVPLMDLPGKYWQGTPILSPPQKRVPASETPTGGNRS